MDPVSATAVFVFGFWFWFAVAAISITLICCIEWDQGWLATATLIATGLWLQFGFHVPVFQYIWENPITSVGWFFGWFAVGTVYAITRWELLIRNQRRAYNEAKARFLESKHVDPNLATIPLNLRGEWARNFSRGRYMGLTVDEDHTGIVVAPRPRNYKSRIYLWIAYWPWSMLWTAINDPIRKMVRAIYNNIAAFLERRSKRVFAGTENDFAEQEVH